jgi:hypothetical protein
MHECINARSQLQHWQHWQHLPIELPEPAARGYHVAGKGRRMPSIVNGGSAKIYLRACVLVPISIQAIESKRGVIKLFQASG